MKLTVVYAYISSPLSNFNLTGLWRNSSIGWQTNNLIFSYIIVMNVTNFSNVPAQVNSIRALVGQSASVDPDTGEIFTTNNWVADYRDQPFVPGFDCYWLAHESRLIGLTGMTGAPQTFYDILNNSNVCVLGQIEAQVIYGKSASVHASDLKQVRLQNVQGNYLYNNLLRDNELLWLSNNGLNVEIVPRNVS